MSTASPSSALGQCVVCGKESTTACSVCRKVGLDWMLFCSKEHQKLIWKVHRRVCGKNPFEWPPLSEKEVEEGWNSRNSAVSPEDSSETLMENYLRRNSNGPVVGYMTRDGGLQSPRDRVYKASLERLRQDTGVNEKQEVLKRHRTAVVFTRLSAVEKIGASKLASLDSFSQDPVGFMAWLMTEQELHLPENVEWSSDIKHRILILFTLVALEIESFFKTGQVYDLDNNPHINHSKSTILSLGTGGLSNVGAVRAHQAVENLVKRILQGSKMQIVDA